MSNNFNPLLPTSGGSDRSSSHEKSEGSYSGLPDPEKVAVPMNFDDGMYAKYK